MSPRTRATRTGICAFLAAAALLLAGCTSGTAAPRAPAASQADFATYVAMGDSFSAGPLIPTTDLAGGCARSDHNYPSLVAERLGVDDFVDVTCSGAETRDVTRAQHPFQGATIPAQLGAVTPAADLVTIGIGGNDLALFSTLISACTRLRTTDPGGAPCTRELAANGPDLGAATTTISRRVAGVIRAVQGRAPEATVVLVGYLRLVPDAGTCADLPLAVGDYAEGRRISVALDRALQHAARRTDVAFVDAYALSRGHDVCAPDPWVNGRVTQRERALAYHPFASGMRAVADALLSLLARDG